MTRTDRHELERLLFKLEKFANPAPIRPLRDTPAIYRHPAKTRPGHVCMDCKRPISYFSGRHCVECYRANARRKYEAKVAKREAQVRIAIEAGL